MTGATGGGQSHNNIQPFNTLNYIIATQGTFPSPNGLEKDDPGARDIDPFLGEMRLFAGNFAPRSWAQARGQLLSINNNQSLFSLLGTTYGGDGETSFALPDLRGRTAVHPGSNNETTIQLGQKYGNEVETITAARMPGHFHTVPPLGSNTSNVGQNQSHKNSQPSLGVNYLVSLSGTFPSQSGSPSQQGDPGIAGDSPFIGEITMFAGNFAPRGWSFGNGQILQIASNSALFSLYGTMYGGDGESVFALPDMKGRAVVHAGRGPGLTPRTIGQKPGRDNVALTVANLPQHNHTVAAPTVLGVTLNVGQLDPDDLPKGPQPTTWAEQRSDILTIDIEFSQPMNVVAADFRLTNLGINAPDDADVEFTLSDNHVIASANSGLVSLTFQPDELPDGVYQLEVLDTAKDVNDNPITGSVNGVAYLYRGDINNKFYQLKADWSGDEGVSVFDFSTFSYWFGKAVPDAPAYADTSRDNGISVFDFTDFSDHFGDGVTYPIIPGFAAVPLSADESLLVSEPLKSQQLPADIERLNDTALDRLLLEWSDLERVETKTPVADPLSSELLSELFSEAVFRETLAGELDLDF
ncbi:MAG: microcystin-dependent protein [Pirellulaceae bacterium]|jgi:microcystin-dependent protein